MSTYLYLPTNDYLPMSAYLPLSTYLPTYLPTYVSLPTYVFLPTFLPMSIYLCLPIYVYLSMSTYLSQQAYLYLDSSFNLCIINSLHPATPNFIFIIFLFIIKKLSISLSTTLPIFHHIYLSIWAAFPAKNWILDEFNFL